MRVKQMSSCKLKALKLMLLTLFIGLAASFASAATTGSISGTVHDEQGAVLPGATVTLRETSTGVVQTLTADTAGFYNFPSLPLGHYDITFEKAGFDKDTESGIVIDVDTQRRVDATLKIGSVQQQITVNATQVAVDTESPQMGEVIGQAQIDAVPLDGRNYTDLLALTPGVVPYNLQNYNSIAPPNNANDGVLSMSGAQEVHSGYVVNGADTVEGVGTGTFVIPVLDSIAEFRLVSNNAGAEYGGYAGGITNVVTKSGTNQFHGDAFEYLRNASLNAKIWGQAGGPTLHQNIFGGTLGGPILRNKVFFFGDYQGLRNSNGSDIVQEVPTQAERNGDLSSRSLMQSSANSVSGSYLAQVLTQRLGYTVLNGEPYASTSCTNNNAQSPNGCVFPTSQIPTKAWDPVALNLMKYVPLPNGVDSEGQPAYVSNAYRATWMENKGAVRVDGNTRFGQLSGYYHLDPSTNANPAPFGTAEPGITNSTIAKAQLFVASLTTPLGSSAVNVFTASYIRNTWIQGPIAGPLAGITFAQQGFDTVANGGPYQLATGQDATVGQINMFGIGTPGVAPVLYKQYNNTYEFEDDFSKVLKTHSLKFGVQYHWDRGDVGHPQNSSNGAFNYGNFTGDNWADYMLGLISNMQQGTPAWLNLRNFYAGIYGEDSWRATSNLTLNFGVRWEVNPFWRDANNRNPVVLPGLVSTRAPGAPVGYAFPGEDGIPEHMANINWDNFGPRFGAAYTPDFGNNPLLRKIFGGHGQSSVRAGYGLYFTNIEGFNTWSFASAPYYLYTSTPQPGFLYEPFRRQDTGALMPQPFPPSPTNFNWATLLPLSAHRSPVSHEASPYEEHFDLSVERQLTPKTILQLAYVGTFGHHLTVAGDVNSGNPALCLSLSQSSDVAPGSPTCGPRGENGNKVYTSASGQVYDGTRQGMGSDSNLFQAVGEELNVGNSAYNAFETVLRHTTDRLMILLSYTWSKAIDNGSGRGDVIFINDQNHFRGLSEYDVPRNLVGTYTYELPFDKLIHGHDLFVRGWKFSGTTRFTDGVPIWFTESDDHNLHGDLGFSPWYYGDDQPVLAAGNVKMGDHNARDQRPWFNDTLFSKEPVGGQGNAPKRFLLGPGETNTDLAVMKDLKVREGLTMEFRAEAFDAWNHANFAGDYNGGQAIDGDLNDGMPNIVNGVNQGGSFGMPQGQASDARRGELVLKVMF